MLVHRLRRWPNIEPALAEHHVFAGYLHYAHLWLNFYCLHASIMSMYTERCILSVYDRTKLSLQNSLV